MCGITSTVHIQIDELVEGGPVPWSPDVTPLDYLLWGSMKTMVYGTPVRQRRTSLLESTERLQRCAAYVRFVDGIWNGHFDAVQRPNRAVPNRGSVLKNNQLAVLHTLELEPHNLTEAQKLIIIQTHLRLITCLSYLESNSFIPLFTRQCPSSQGDSPSLPYLPPVS